VVDLGTASTTLQDSEPFTGCLGKEREGKGRGSEEGGKEKRER
jgi:hypothetical protein